MENSVEKTQHTKRKRRSKKRRRWSVREKSMIVEEALQSSVGEVSRKEDIHTCQLYSWIKQFEQGGMVTMGSKKKVHSDREFRDLKNKLNRKERMIIDLLEQLQICQEALDLSCDSDSKKN